MRACVWSASQPAGNAVLQCDAERDLEPVSGGAELLGGGGLISTPDIHSFVQDSIAVSIRNLVLYKYIPVSISYGTVSSGRSYLLQMATSRGHYPAKRIGSRMASNVPFRPDACLLVYQSLDPKQEGKIAIRVYP